LVTNLPVAAAVEAVGDEGVLVDALGLGVVAEAAGGGDVVVEDAAGGGDVFSGDAGGDDVCASALVNANALTAVTAMTCFNMSASWGDCANGVSVAGLTGVLLYQRVSTA